MHYRTKTNCSDTAPYYLNRRSPTKHFINSGILGIKYSNEILKNCFTGI